MAQLKKIAFNDVGIKALQLKKRLLSAFSSVVDSSQFLHGKENNKLRLTLQNYFKTPFVHLVASGHDALLLSIQSLSLKPDDEVVVPANAYPTAFPVALSGVKMILCDVDENGQINISCLRKSITKKTKAVILVHLFGFTTNIDEIVKIIKENHLYLIEDCAQAFGTKYKGKLVGTFGDIGCFSFYPTKNLASLGEGGAVITKHENISTFIQSAKTYGEKLRYKSEFVAGHSRLPELQAAGLNMYFETIKKDSGKRKKMFEYYLKKLHKVRILISDSSSNPVPHLLVIECEKRNKLAKHLAQTGIEVHIHYPLPIHLVKAFSYLGYKEKDFPMSEKLSKNILSLPFHPYITKNQIDHIIKQIQVFYEKAI